MQLATYLEDWWNVRGHTGKGKRRLLELLEGGEGDAIDYALDRAYDSLRGKLGDQRVA